jgi:transcriptional regulator GlxA family with amidase domain
VEFLPLRPEIPEEARILEKMKEVFSFSPAERGYEFRLRAALSEIWLGIMELMEKSPTRSGNDGERNEKIKRLMVHIHEHYSEPISVDDLAAVVHVSRRACFRIFQESLHMTPVEYMRDVRLERACSLLTRTNLPVTEIGYACGLGSASYFGKAFRQRYGCSPLEFRKKWHDRDNYGHK